MLRVATLRPRPVCNCRVDTRAPAPSHPCLCVCVTPQWRAERAADGAEQHYPAQPLPAAAPLCVQSLHNPVFRHSPPDLPPAGFLAPPAVVPSWLGAPQYRASTTVSLAALSPSGTWDRLTWDAAGNRLFVGLQTDGLAVIKYGTAVNGMLGAVVGAPSLVTGTSGTNGLVIAGTLGFAGDAAGFTGTGGVYGNGVTVVNMASLTVKSVVPIAQGVGVDNAVYDKFSSTVIAVLVNGSMVSMNPTTGAVVKTANVVSVSCAPSQPCDPLEFPVSDGKGFIYANNAPANTVVQVNAKTLAVTATYNTATSGCYDPTGLDIDVANNLLFIGCGDASMPMLLVMNAATGAAVATVPIGRGNDGVIYDSQRMMVYASSGTVGTITVIQQNAATNFAVREVLFSAVGCRTLALDPATGTLFTATGEGRYNPSVPIDADSLGTMFSSNEFFGNTVRVLSFVPTSVSGR